MDEWLEADAWDIRTRPATRIGEMVAPQREAGLTLIFDQRARVK
jgi:hypothetical protein